MIPYRENCILEILSQTCDSTPGTQSAHAHGLGYAPSKRRCFPKQTVADNSSDTAGSIVVVKTDATSVYVKSNKASATFDLFIALQHNTAPNNDA